MKLKFFILDRKTYNAEYKKAFIKVHLQSESAKKRFRDKIFSTQGAIVEALKQKWTENDDWAVGWDFSYCYYACGGIYSERIFCREYLETIVKALRSVPEPSKWTYHTVCEILVNPDGKTAAETTDFRGELFVRDGAVFIPRRGMKKRHRLGLGSPE